MNKNHINSRLKLALKYLKDKSRSSKVIFSDEKKFKLNSDSKTEYISREIGTDPYEEKYMQYDTRLSTKADVNIWAYIGPFGKGISY